MIHRGWKQVGKIIATTIITIVLLLAALFVYFNLPVSQSDAAPVSLGVTFSHKYARDLGLDWQEAYTAILDDLGVRKLRLVAYWDEIEKENGVYDFSYLDWQLKEARSRDAKVILAIGQRVPRWPECHIPAWMPSDAALRQEALAKYMRVIVERYRSNHSEIILWQVENEPFLPFFGECPPLDEEFFSREIALVKSIDSRPVLTTDSGELSAWYRAASYGDVFGTTMYRDIYKPGFGYFRYPLGPNFFRFKEWYTRRIVGEIPMMVVELQGEPWAPGWVADISLQEQAKTMNPNLLREHISYARRSGFSEIYLWGAEWWYWLLKEKHSPEMWESAKDLI